MTKAKSRTEPQRQVRQKPRKKTTPYGSVLREMVSLLDQARSTAVRSVNVVMTATYWEMGRRIVQHEQAGSQRANYGVELMQRLAIDLTERYGRGFGQRNISSMRSFYMAYPNILQTVSAKWQDSIRALPTKASGRNTILQTVSAKSRSSFGQPITAGYFEALAHAFPLPWSHYVRLLTVEDPAARQFYITEALRGGWSVRQLDRQVSTRYYERTALSRNKVAMLQKGAIAQQGEQPSIEDGFQDPFILEFANLPDQFSESVFEDALLKGLEQFLLELGSDFAFIGRQRRLRIGLAWYRVDLLFFHRKLRCLVIIDLKVGRFTHSDAGQMNLYLNYAREHWINPDENPPVGLILCTQKDDAVAHYSMSGIGNKVLAAQYKLALPNEKKLAAALERARRQLTLRTTRSKKN